MRRIVLATLAFALLVTPAFAQQRDVAGSRDYPGIGRFKGSVVTGYQVRDFDRTRLQAAPFKDGKPTGERRPEGRVTRIAYRAAAGPSILEVSAQFRDELAGSGYETLLACDADACGGIPFAEALDVLPIPQMWVDGFDFRYFAGRQERRRRATPRRATTDDIWTQVVVTQVGAIENKMVDAAAMAKGLGDKGHIALYGIYFNTDKATLKPESKPTLDEIAKLLRAQGSLNVFLSVRISSRKAWSSSDSSSCIRPGPPFRVAGVCAHHGPQAGAAGWARRPKRLDQRDQAGASRASRSAASTLPTSPRERARTCAVRCTSSLAGVGTPCSRPSSTISPER